MYLEEIVLVSYFAQEDNLNPTLIYHFLVEDLRLAIIP